MKNLIYILFGLLLGCSGLRDYNSNPKKVYSLVELAVNQRSNKRINFNKVEGVVVDIEKLKINRLTEKGFELLSDCHAVEYILIKYPKGYLENDYSLELSEAISGINGPKEIYMTLDSADYIPNVFHRSNEIQQITIEGNFIKEASVNTLSQKSLKVLYINCSTNSFSFSGKNYNDLELLSLIINGKIKELDFLGLKELKKLTLVITGKIEEPDISDLKKLEFLGFRNVKIEYLSNDFFELPDLKTLILSVPKLKDLNENISNLKSLKHLIFTSYEINELPESLSKLENLRQFSINTTDSIISLKPLTTNPKLRNLSISGINILEVVDEVLLMKKLKTLDFDLRPLLNQDLTPLGQLEKLEEIGFKTAYVERDGDIYIHKELPDSTINEVLDQLKKVLPEHFK